jgi:hypothetical protein
MPKLLLFAPCRKVLIDSDDNSLSLLEVMEVFGVTLLPNATPAPTDVLPLPWGVITLWAQTPEDGGIEYEQRLQVIRPNGETFVEGTMSFTMTHRTQRNRIALSVIPVGQVGEYRLRLSLRRAGTNARWQTKAEYPLEVRHIPQAQAAE